MDKQQEQNSTMHPLSIAGGRSTSVLQRSRQATTADDAVLLGATRIPESEEVLIMDGRANLGPAQQVENKLSTLLRSCPLPISHVRITSLGGSRRSC